jgi:ketosteroid isomerase-like protein
MLRMSDFGEITALVNSYALLLDAGDMDAVTALFAHSTWRSEPNGQVLRGIEEIKPVYEQLKTYDGSPRTKHLLTNLTVDVETGASTASAHCYWTVLQNIASGSAINIILSGQYADKFEKAEGAWRFSDRLITVDLTGDTAAHVD